MALTFRDINFVNKTININKTYTRHGEDIINEPKTPKSKREIATSDSLCEDMKKYKNNPYDYKENHRIFNFTNFF